MKMKFSVCMSVYRNDAPLFLEQAIDSIVKQSVRPDEVVLVVDGPIPDALRQKVLDMQKEFPNILPIFLPENNGLGNALKVAVEKAKYNIIARMDSDDICMPDRFKKQLAYLESHPKCDIVGGQITEFIETPSNIVGKREVPLDNDAIYNYMRNRCALNHPTVMFRKDAILEAGNYQDWFWNEDYYLWIRMMMNKCEMANLPDVLVNMRSGYDQYSRRGGMRYFKSEVRIKKLMLENGMISKTDYIINYIERFVIQLLLPNSIRGWVIRTFARKKR